jgi:hypothetical protein
LVSDAVGCSYYRIQWNIEFIDSCFERFVLSFGHLIAMEARIPVYWSSGMVLPSSSLILNNSDVFTQRWKKSVRCDNASRPCAKTDR